VINVNANWTQTMNRRGGKEEWFARAHVRSKNGQCGGMCLRFRRLVLWQKRTVAKLLFQVLTRCAAVSLTFLAFTSCTVTS